VRNSNELSPLISPIVVTPAPPRGGKSLYTRRRKTRRKIRKSKKSRRKPRK
jgi:hypothetical protein